MNAIRDARPDDCASLSLLACISKASWGYDDAFMEACRDELTVRPEDLERGRVRVFDDGELVGFHGVIVEHGSLAARPQTPPDRPRSSAFGARLSMAPLRPHDGELQWMFVAPAAIGCGIGVLLWADAVEVARGLGVEVLRIEADPNAAGFYERMGAVRVGETPSASIPGRELPVYEFAVSSERE